MPGSYLTAPLRAVLQWLRAGYPDGVPQSDYVALFAVLHRRLTEAEIAQIASAFREARSEEPVTIAQIRDAIGEIAKEQPGDDDIERVTARLEAAGFVVDR